MAEEIRNISVRRRNLFYLIQRYLQDNGMYSSAEAVAKEAKLSEDFELCDNIDLDAIYLEFASYMQLKLGKYPRILRAVKPEVKLELAAKRKKSKPGQQAMAKKQENESAKPKTAETLEMEMGDLTVTVKKLETSAEATAAAAATAAATKQSEELHRLQNIQHGNGNAAVDELLSGIGNTAEWQQLADLVKTTIMKDELNLKWTDICGNTHAMELLKEAVLTPIKYPQLFVHGLKPWKSVLLHGPPGSGKTLLARTLYAETKGQVTFFNVTSSVVISKWRGESEKLIRVLFHLAQRYSPSIIFFDEIEGLTSKRDRPSDHEATKRLKNELLQLLDGMEQKATGVFILASTNLPWDVDEAFLRRFEKKLLVQLPNAVERARLIGRLLPLTLPITAEKMNTFVKYSENFTGDEIRLACKEIAMQNVRRVTKAKTHTHPTHSKLAAAASGVAAGGGGGGGGVGVSGTAEEAVLKEKPIEHAFEQIKPLSVKLMGKHLKWQMEHGS